MPLWLTEADVGALVTPLAAVDAVERCCERLARGAIENRPRERLGLEGGQLAVLAASDLECGYAGLKSSAVFPDDSRSVVLLFETERAELAAVIEAERLGQLRTGAASGVAVRHLARPEARSAGVIGCGRQAESQIAGIRAALPQIETVVAYCRTAERLHLFCERNGCEPAESPREAAAQDVVVTATTSADPVIRGEWLREGALVLAIGANDGRSRELDDAVLERAGFVVCDLREQARAEAADLTEPIEHGVLDWLEVHELHEVVLDHALGRGSDADIVVFKSNGIAAWDIAVGALVLERARTSGAGLEL